MQLIIEVNSGHKRAVRTHLIIEVHEYQETLTTEAQGFTSTQTWTGYEVDSASLVSYDKDDNEIINKEVEYTDYVSDERVQELAQQQT